MALASFAHRTVYVLDPVLVDDHGTQVPDWTQDPTRVRVDGCIVEPLTSDEILANRQATEVTWRVLAPAAGDELAALVEAADGSTVRVRSTSRIEWGGVAHDVVGEPGRQDSPSGTLDHVVILTSSWEG